MDMITVCGVLGAFLVLMAFVLAQFHVWKNTDLKYGAVNLIGSLLLVFYGVLIHAYPFVVLNSVWAIVSARDVVKAFLRI